MSFVEVLDVVLTAVPIYALMVNFRRARSSLVFMGIFISGLCYLAARLLGLKLLAMLIQGFFAVILFAIIVIFQEELRQMFEGIAVRVLGGRWRRRRGSRAGRPDVEVLVKTATSLAEDRIGALIVLEGASSLSRHLQGGVKLDGELSVPLLESIFDPSSHGHDGAVVIAGGRVTQFSCRLPLSSSTDGVLEERGTRHAAALGLAERSDALCLVVSEEKGTISIARNGRLEPVSDPTSLDTQLDEFLAGADPHAVRTLLSGGRHGATLKAAALALSMAMWFFLIHESAIAYDRFQVSVVTSEAPTGYSLKKLEPLEVSVELSGPRRAFYFVQGSDLRLNVRILDAGPGQQTLPLSASDLDLPEGLKFEKFLPDAIRVTLEPKGSAPAVRDVKE